MLFTVAEAVLFAATEVVLFTVAVVVARKNTARVFSVCRNSAVAVLLTVAETVLVSPSISRKHEKQPVNNETASFTTDRYTGRYSRGATRVLRQIPEPTGRINDSKAGSARTCWT